MKGSNIPVGAIAPGASLPIWLRNDKELMNIQSLILLQSQISRCYLFLPPFIATNPSSRTLAVLGEYCSD